MIFHEGDKLILKTSDESWYYTIVREELDNSIQRILVRDEDGDYVLLNKATISKRLGTSWTYCKKYDPLPEDLFHV